MKTLTIQQLSDLGFEVTKCYTHDHFITQRRVKGCLTVETTWDRNNDHLPCSQDVTIEEIFIESFSKKELKALDKLLNKKSKKETREDYGSNKFI